MSSHQKYLPFRLSNKTKCSPNLYFETNSIRIVDFIRLPGPRVLCLDENGTEYEENEVITSAFLNAMKASLLVFLCKLIPVLSKDVHLWGGGVNYR